MGRLPENKEYEHICGNCKRKFYYKIEPPIPCPECGYIHGSEDILNVPEEVKIPLGQL